MPPLKGIEFAHHAADQIRLGEASGTGRIAGVHPARGSGLRQPAAQRFQTAGLVGHAAQSGDEDDVFQFFQPGVQFLPQILMPEEAGILQTGAQHALPAVLDHGHVLRRQVEHRQEMRHELAVRPFDAETLLVALHAGQQHLGRHFQIGGVKIPQQRHGMLHQPLHFLQQAVAPEHLAAGGLRQLVAALHDDLPAGGRVNGDGALFGHDGQIVRGPRDAERPRPVDAVAAGLAPARHRPHAEGGDFFIQQGHDPAQRPRIGQSMRAPAHALGKGQARDDRRADLRQQIARRRAARMLAHRHIFALLRLDAVDVRHGQPVRARKAFQRLGRIAGGIVGGTHRRPGDLLLPLLLHGVHVLDDDHGAPRRAHDPHLAVLHGGLVQRGTKTGGKLRLFHRQKTGRQFFAADLKYKSRHDYFAPLSMG